MRRRYVTRAGYTLVEALFVIAIISILVTTASPAFSQFLIRQEVRTNLRTVTDLLRLGRSTAVTRNTRITFCFSPDKINCDKNGGKYAVLFADEDDSHTIATSEMIQALELRFPDAASTMRISASRNYLRFRPNGRTIEFGTLLFCPSNHDPALASLIIINASGRPRYGRDNNSDGITEDRNGNNVSC